MPEDKSELDKSTPAKVEGAPETPKPAAAASPTSDVKPAVPAAAKPAAPVAAKPAAPAPPPKPAPKPWESELVASLKRQYGSGIREASVYLKDQYLVVDKSIVFDVLKRLREEDFDYCVDVTAVHWPKREEQFDVVYILYSFAKNERVRIETAVKEGETVRSVYSLWPTADWLEREVFDMFGIGFAEHPGLKRILLPEEWTGYPLRKDYGIRQQDQKWVNKFIGIESGQ